MPRGGHRPVREPGGLMSALADRRGLTGAGAVVTALVLGAVGGAVDLATGRGLGLWFAVAFVAGCALATLGVHRDQLAVAVVMPPLVYVVLAFAGGAVEGVTASGSLLTRQVVELADAVILGAPVLLTATAAALLLALLRGFGRRH